MAETDLELELAQWHYALFGDVDLPKTLRKLGEEFGELAEAIANRNGTQIVEEAADCALVLTHIVRGISNGGLQDAMRRKFNKVKQRTGWSPFR